ncbi:unnamed protein product [Calypogeia fissa]
MAQLSPRTKSRVQQISVFRKASDRSKRMVTAELMKKAELPPLTKKKTPLKVSGASLINSGSPAPPAPPAPRPIKRNRAGDHVYDSSGAPEVRRSVVQRNGVVKAVAPVVDDVEPTRPAQSNAAAPDSARELHEGTFPSPCKENVPRQFPVRLASVIERPAAADDEEAQRPSGVVLNAYHHQEAEVRDVQTEQCSDHSPVVEAYRLVDNGVTCGAAVHSAPPPILQVQESATASPQANGFETLLRRVGSQKPVCPTTVSEVNGDSDVLALGPPVQSVQRRPASPEYIAAPVYFHGLWNLGNTCYMNTIIQILYNLECFAADLGLSANLPLRRDGIFLGLKQVFLTLTESTKNQVVNPTCLQQACEKYMTDFEGSVQQDAQEYLLNVLDKIEEEIGLSHRQLWEELQTVPAKRETICPTTRNFSCQVRNILSCEGCDDIVNVEQSCRHFSLPLPEDRRDSLAEIPDIEALMNIYFQVETLSRKCEKCGAETMKSETKIVQLPRVLILHINRFEIDRHMLCSKVSIPVKFPNSLDLGNWCLDKVRGPCIPEVFFGNGREYVNGHLPALEDCRENSHHSSGDRIAVPEVRNSVMPNGKMYDSDENGFGASVSTTYSLHGVVSHVGKLASCGHYTVDIYDIDSSKYIRCDDAVVREVLSEDVFCEEKFSEAYVLLYVLQQNGA